MEQHKRRPRGMTASREQRRLEGTGAQVGMTPVLERDEQEAALMQGLGINWAGPELGKAATLGPRAPRPTRLIPSTFPGDLLCATPGARHWGNSLEQSGHSPWFMAGAHSQDQAHRQGRCNHNHGKASGKKKKITRCHESTGSLGDAGVVRRASEGLEA